MFRQLIVANGTANHKLATISMETSFNEQSAILETTGCGKVLHLPENWHKSGNHTISNWIIYSGWMDCRIRMGISPNKTAMEMPAG